MVVVVVATGVVVVVVVVLVGVKCTAWTYVSDLPQAQQCRSGKLSAAAFSSRLGSLGRYVVF